MQTLMTFSSATTPDIQNYFLGLLVVALIVVLMLFVQATRHRIRSIQRGAQRPNANSQLRVRKEKRIQEYLDHANFSNEGNPNCGWQAQFSERSAS